MTDLTARIAIDKPTHQKVQILASKAVKFNGFDQIDQLVRSFVDDAWQEALNAGMVKESMLKKPEQKAKAARHG